MTDTDTRLSGALRREQQRREADNVPDFDAIWNAAETAASRRPARRRAAAGLAAAVALAAIAAGLWLPQEQDWQYVNPDDFATGTAWVAPSDVLLPDHQIDIYRDIPVLIESTDSNGGALL
jgi:ferric-dicitrate binding protein FerR (iron transport regulator)